METYEDGFLDSFHFADTVRKERQKQIRRDEFFKNLSEEQKHLNPFYKDVEIDYKKNILDEYFKKQDLKSLYEIAIYLQGREIVLEKQIAQLKKAVSKTK